MAFGGTFLILLADANILIDMEHVDAIDILAKIAPCDVLDVVLEECDHESQPDIVNNILNSGITVVETTQLLAQNAALRRTGKISTVDMMHICYAEQHGHIVLAGDRPLRERCAEEGVCVRGSFWIVEEAYRLALVEREELCRWLRVWPMVGRRLPATEINRLRQELGCR